MVKRAALGAWEFVVGDDWRVALGIAAMLAATALIAALGLPAWWLSPIATLAILHRSVRRATSGPPPRRRFTIR
jgi:hypothetical protein